MSIARRGGGATTTIVDDLTTGGTTAALSAEQGKNLQDNKADALAQGTLGSGTTAITRASHLNRPLIVNQAGGTTGTFAATATSGALPGDSFYIRNTGAGTFTAAGAITASSGFKLTAGAGEYFSADYDSVDDTFVSTTVDLSSVTATFNLGLVLALPSALP